MNLKDFAKSEKEKNHPEGTECEPPHPGETCHDYLDRTAADLIAESDGTKPRPNQKVWDMFAEYRAKLSGQDWQPPFPEIYREQPCEAKPQGISDCPRDPDPFEQAHRDMGF